MKKIMRGVLLFGMLGGMLMSCGNKNEGNQKEAIKWYLASIQKGNLWAYDNLAILYIDLGDYDNAEKLAKKGFQSQ